MPTIQERLATIETKQDYIIKQLDTIVTNHLPHIYKRLEQLENCQSLLMGAGSALQSPSQFHLSCVKHRLDVLFSQNLLIKIWW